MQYRKINGTDLLVSPICLGTMTFGTPVSPDDAVKLTEYALDRGINFIDTANMYEGYARTMGSSGGVAEECLGRIAAKSRSRMILATKVGMNVGPGPYDNGLSSGAIEANLTKSLRRMQTDYVDIYYAHRFDAQVAPADLASAMNREIDRGRIRCYAVSNYTGAQLLELLHACDENHLRRPVLCQPPLSLMDIESLRDIIYVCQRENISLAPYKILAGGLLTGKYAKGQPAPEGSRKNEKPGWLPDLSDAEVNRLEAIRETCLLAGVSMTRYAVQFVLDQPGVVSAIVGVKNKDQIDLAVEAAE